MVFPSQDPELVLVGNRSVLVKVNAVAASAGAAKPSGVLRIDDANGVLLGTGGSLTVTNLPVGEHSVWLYATNSLGMEGRMFVPVEIWSAP